MTLRRLYHVLLAVAVVAVPAGVAAWWWQYGPVYQRARTLAAAERAAAEDNLPRAEELLRALVVEDANQPHVQIRYAGVLRRLGRREEAWVALQRALQAGLPGDEGRREYALLEVQEDFGRAEPNLRRLLQDRPDDLEVLQALARGYALAGRWLDAERMYTHWLQQEPGRAEALLERGQVFLQEGRTDRAASDFRDILAQTPKHYQARLLLAHCLLSEARPREAESELQACRKLRPTRPEPLVGLARCALERGDLDAAEALVKEALAFDPGEPLALHLCGDLYLRRQRYDLAVPVFEEILRRNRNDKQAHLKLAQALSRTGDRDGARQHEERFRELDAADQRAQGGSTSRAEPSAPGRRE
jgi:tetratricopeptide (TPR) repeat protein